MIRRPPRSTQSRSSAASDVYKRQGLDTSVCVPLLRDRYQYEKIITVTVDVGQPQEDLEKAEARGARLSDKHYTVDAKNEFVEVYLFPLIKANGSYEGYTLGQAIARPLIAKKVLEVADREPVSYTHLRAHETRHDLVCRL